MASILHVLAGFIIRSRKVSKSTANMDVDMIVSICYLADALAALLLGRLYNFREVDNFQSISGFKTEFTG